MRRPAIAFLLILCALPVFAQDLPITSGSIPGYFAFFAGNDVLDDPPSLYIQLGDGRVVFGQAMSFTQPIVPRQTTALPYIDAAGNFQAGAITLELAGIELQFTSPPTGTFRLESGQVHITLSGTALISWQLDDGSSFQLTQQLAITTGQASADADGIGPLLLFGNTRINGIPFNSASGAGAFAAAFTIPKDLPQSAIDQLTALLAQQGLGLDGSILLGAPVGLRISGTFTEANVAAPRIIPNGGDFMGSVSVAIECDTPGAAIRYTVDGTTPTINSAAYTGTFTLTDSAMVTARAFLANYNDSPVTQASFTVIHPRVTIEAPATRLRPGGGTVTVNIYGEGLFGFGGMQTALVFRRQGAAVPDFVISLDGGNPSYGGQAIFHNESAFPSVLPVFDEVRLCGGFMSMGNDVDLPDRTFLLSMKYDIPPSAPPGVYEVGVDADLTVIGGSQGGIDCTIVPGTITVGWATPGDVDGNCRVNILDLITIRSRLGQATSTGDNWIADVNRDGSINILDLIAVRNSLNNVCR